MSTSLLDSNEVNRARIGPRDMKDPASREYAIQTLYSLKRYLESKEIDERRLREELDIIKEHQHWKVLGYGSLDEYLRTEAGLAVSGMSADRLPTPGHALKYFQDGSMSPIKALALFFASWGQLGRVPTGNDYGMLYRALKEILPAVKEWPQQPVVYWSGEDANGTPKYQAVLTSYEKFKRYLEPFGPLFDAHEFIRAYEAGTAADYIASIEPARKQGAPEGNQNASKGQENKGSDSTVVHEKPARKQKRDAEYFIARLKRDANDGNTQAAALLGGSKRARSSRIGPPSKWAG